MSRSTKRSTTSIKSRGLILQLMEDMLPEKSLISLNAQRWCRMGIYTKELKSLYGRLLAMTRKTKFFLTGMFFLKAAFSRCRSWMSKIDYLSEEMYNIWKEDLMPNKKKKNKKKIKKKKKAKKKKKKR